MRGTPFSFLLKNNCKPLAEFKFNTIMNTKIKIIAIILLAVIYSCSKDDNNRKSNWKVGLAPDCENKEVENRILHCVTEEEYNRLDNLPSVPCQIITLTDIFGNTHRGVPLSFRFNIDGQSCN